jgi:SpoVK/Ycf46/Vps4 family AAA+-type ATPase
MPKTTSVKQLTAERSLVALPLNRDRLPMATIVERDKLRHNMVLPDTTEDRFRRIECEYAARDRLAAHNLHYRQKLLLYGVPGCGKTLGAERLAWNTGLTLVKVQFDSLISSLMGDTGKNLRKVFEEVNETPCVLFFDECDSILRTREDDKDVGEVKRVVNTFLQVLDEYNPNNGLIVMATNLTKSLDPAVWRRFDDVIELPKPGKAEAQLLLVQTLKASFSEEVHDLDWNILLTEMEGFSAAQVVKIVQNAAKAAILQYQIKTVTQSLLLDTIQEIKEMPSHG